MELSDAELAVAAAQEPRATVLTCSATASMTPLVLSTTLALAWVAAGRRAGYVSDGHLRDSVHFASAIALCQAAGCVVTDLRGQTLHSGDGGLVAAADEPTHAELLAIIDEQLPG